MARLHELLSARDALDKKIFAVQNELYFYEQTVNKATPWPYFVYSPGQDSPVMGLANEQLAVEVVEAPNKGKKFTH